MIVATTAASSLTQLSNEDDGANDDSLSPVSTDNSSSSSAVSPIASPLIASSSESSLQSASDVPLNSMQVSLPSQTGLNTFKLVGDNIDKEVQPREMHSDYQLRSPVALLSYLCCERLSGSEWH